MLLLDAQVNTEHIDDTQSGHISRHLAYILGQWEDIQSKFLNSVTILPLPPQATQRIRKQDTIIYI